MIIKTLIGLAWKSLYFRRGAVIITITAIAISVLTLLSVEHLRLTAKQSFSSTVSGVDLIVGPRTGDINLLLTTVFRIGHPSQNMSWKSYQTLVNHPKVSWTIPISLGDSHRGFRVVGTEPQFFSHFQYGQSRDLEFAEGKAFSDLYDVVLGSSVAQSLGYTVGQKLVIAHGIGKTSFQKHDAFPFQVSGILKVTGTPVDNALYVSLTGLESIHQPPALRAGKSTRSGKNTHASKKDSALIQAVTTTPKSISATMVGLTSKLATFKVQRDINTSVAEPLTAILPGVTLTQLWQMSRGLESALNIMATLILCASLLGLGAVMIANLRERTYEFSILRMLGTGSFSVFFLIQLEALFVSLLGVLFGGIVFVSGILLLSDHLAVTYGIDIGLSQLSPTHAVVVLYVVAGTLITSVLPALTGFLRSRTS